jgi:hypothetical protein
VDVSELLATFSADFGSAPGTEDVEQAQSSVREIVGTLGGVSLAGGLYRVFPAGSIASWTTVPAAAFPMYTDRAVVFGADWLGRLFAADSSRVTGSFPQVLMFDLGAREVLEIPCTVATMHVSEMLQAPDALLALPFYKDWRSISGDQLPLGLGECVGYQIPLWLGGADEVSNLERTDMDGYWSLVGQMKAQTTGLPAGTPIQGVHTQDAIKKRGRPHLSITIKRRNPPSLWMAARLTCTTVMVSTSGLTSMLRALSSSADMT